MADTPDAPHRIIIIITSVPWACRLEGHFTNCKKNVRPVAQYAKKKNVLKDDLKKNTHL
jgi:hypothetical protein